MDLARARYLVSDEGRAAVAALADAALPPDPLARVSALRRLYGPSEASALAEQCALRERAAARFGELLPARWLWTSDGIEMITHPLVAGRRARRLASSGGTLLDLTCGLGGDLNAAAAAGLPATGLEIDPVSALLAASNLDGAASIVRGDALRPPFRLERRAVLLDPSRRRGGARSFDPAAFSPPWDDCLGLAGCAATGVIKAPPGIQERWVPPAAEVEFVQVGRSLREATIWLGKGAEPGLRRAALLPAGAEIDSRMEECDPEPVAARAFVVDPESCVTRAGLVRQLAATIGARLADRQVAYLWADDPAATPLATSFEVLDIVEFSVARLRRRLRERHWRPDEIRRRAFPVEPDELRRLLGPLAGERVSLLCTTLAGKRLVIAGRRVGHAG